VASAGVKVTLSLAVPDGGAVVGVVHAKIPVTAVPFAEAAPPVSVDDASVWPYAIVLAVGHAETVGVALPTVTVTDPITVV
jgi:hypothetical protein